MRKLLIIIGAVVFGWVGWWLGSGLGVMGAYLLSSVGSIAGVYIGWRINRDYF